ncbi:MAG: glycosyltransferase family 4 protein [Candidatus Glassbacteria bacterium]
MDKISLTLFFTAGVSLDSWAAAGNLDRELTLYKKLLPHLKKISLVSYGGKSDRKYRHQIEGLKLLSVPWHLRQQLTALHLTAKYFPHLAATDVLKTNQIRGARIPIWLKKIFRKKLIVRCGFLHGYFTRQQTADEKRILEAVTLERAAFTAADLCVVTSAWQKEAVVSDYGIAPEKIKVIPNYVVTGIFKPDPGIEKKFDLVFIGRGDSQKNLPNLLEALNILKSRDRRYSLRLVGACSEREDLRREAQAKGLDVAFSGNVPNFQLPAVLNEARAFILPSFYEGHPKTLLEAMSCGLPCIGAEAPGIREEIRHESNGWLCRTDPAGLATAIETVLGNETLGKTLGENARKHAVENYDIDRIVELELEALREVVQ